MVASDSDGTARRPGLGTALAAGLTAGFIAAWSDLLVRLGLAATEGVRGFDFALVSYVGFVSLLLGLTGLAYGLLLFGASRAVHWPLSRFSAGFWLAAPATLGQAWLLLTRGAPLGETLGDKQVWLPALLAVVVAYALASLCAPVLWGRRRVAWIGAAAMALCFLGGAWIHARANHKEPARDVFAAERVANPDAPDVLLVTLDTTRADRLGCYGYEAARTPNLDRLAAEGTLYERAFAPNPSTQPSHASILTGLQPPWHGMRINGTAALDQQATSVSQVLAQQGYETRAVLASFVLDRQFGLVRGFALYDDFVPTTFGPAGVQRRMMRSVLGPGLGSQVARRLGLVELFEVEFARTAEQVTAAALSMLTDAPTDRPLFLWVHYWDPHAPYNPPEEFLEAWTPEPDAPAGGYEYWFGTLGSLAEVNARYDGEVAYMDSELGALLEAFRARPRPGVIAVTADHGEGLQEHGVPTHGSEVYDVTLHVPLILAGDGVPAGERVTETVASYDLAPTILALAGAPALPEGQGRRLQPFDGSAPACDSDRRFYHEAAKSGRAAWREGDWKLVLRHDEQELYDHSGDPAEHQNLVAQLEARVASLLEQLERYRAQFPEKRGVQLTDESDVQSKLAELGYTDDGE